MESKTDFGTVSVAKVMDAIETAFLEAKPNERGAICYLMGYISTELGVSSTLWIRSLHAREDKKEIEESE